MDYSRLLYTKEEIKDAIAGVLGGDDPTWFNTEGDEAYVDLDMVADLVVLQLDALGVQFKRTSGMASRIHAPGGLWK